MRSTEWLLSLSLLLVIASFVMIAKIQSSRVNVKPLAQAKEVAITIEGNVRKPGTYSTEIGTPVIEVLRKAKPKPLSDLKNFTGRVMNDCTLLVEKLDTITVYIEGAVVNCGALKIPAGTKLCGLKQFLELGPDADKAIFKKRRMLKDGERIVVDKKISIGLSSLLFIKGE